jgi:predicted transport protein
MEKGFKDSRLRLNDDLATLEHWNEHEINNRAQRLAELAAMVWPYPQLPHEILQKYQKTEKSTDLKIYTLANHPHIFERGVNENLFQELRKRILNLDASVTEEILKIYIAYKTSTTFVHVVPLKSRLSLTLYTKFGDIQDPKGSCKDGTGKWKVGNADIEVWLTSPDQLDDVMALVKQSFEKHSDMSQ